MYALAINGSPRKKGNTAQMLESVLRGTAADGAQMEMVHLYDYRYTGCISCFECKRKGGKNYGKCAMQDELTVILEKAWQAEILILGSPIYFGDVTGEMRSFFERLVFPFTSYDREIPTLFSGTKKTAVIYTMNVADDSGYRPFQQMTMERTLKRLFGQVESLAALDTYQFEDYSQYHAPLFDEKAKREKHETSFPQDLQKAYELGRKLVLQ